MKQPGSWAQAFWRARCTLAAESATGFQPDEKKREWMLAVDGLRELARRAEHYGVVLSVEPLNRYRTSVANTAGQVLRMVEEVDAPNVGVHFDTYHACLEERDLCAALEQVLQAGKVNHFHACANNRGAPDRE